jgi:translocation and assembly module TamB
MFAMVGVLPIGLTLLARSSELNAWAAKESARALSAEGLQAGYAIQVRLVPLALELTGVRVEATDGKGPALTSDRISVRPRIFALLAGKLVLDQVEIDEPAIRLVMKDGVLQNLALHLPKSSNPNGKTVIHAPFSVFAVTGASVDLTLDDAHLTAKDIDIDLTTDDDGPEGSSFEIATRVGHALFQRSRAYTPHGATELRLAIDDDELCSLDARVRYEPHMVLVRRLSAQGSADLDVASDTAPRCDLAATDKRRVEIDVSHLRVVIPEKSGAIPHIDGHVRLRAPLGLAERAAALPETDGWVGVETDVRMADDTTLPELDGHLEAHDIKLAKYRFAQEIQADFEVHKNIVRAPKVMVRIADGVANVTDAQVEPLSKGMPLRGKLDATGVSFFALMRDLGISPHPHVTWDIKELHVPLLKGTILPLHLDGEVTSRTANFAVADRAIDDPLHQRILGFKEATFTTHVAIRPVALEFSNVNATVGKSEVSGGLCSIGFDEKLRVDVPKAKIELTDLSPLVDIPLAGQGEVEVHVFGEFTNPQLEGNVSIANFGLGDIPFGNVTSGHVHFEGTRVDLSDLKAQKGKSAYEMPQARLEFGGKASMELDGVATTTAMDLRDFLAIWKFEDDPRFQDLEATLATRASIHLAMGGPEDTCGGGLVDVRAGVHATKVKLYGEEFDDGDADLEFRQFDRAAGIAGSDVSVRALTLHKFHPPGKEPSGSVLASGRVSHGGALHADVVMEAIPLFRVQSLGAFRTKTEGTVSGIATADGTLDRFNVVSDIDVSPARIRGTPLGASHLHVSVLQTSAPGRAMGKTRCGAPIVPPFDKEAFLADTSSHGEVAIDGDLAGGAVHFDHVVVTRAPKPLITGKIGIHELDLGALTKIATPPDVGETDDLAVSGASKDDFAGTISGDLSIDRAQVGELEHAKVRFAPASLTFSRGAERVVMKQTKETLTLDEDRLTVPSLDFDLQAAHGFKGAFTLHGAVTHTTHDAELALALDLSPIDLGLLVGVIPKVDRATGQLTGKVLLAGRARSPHVDGDLHVAGGELSIHGLPSVVSDMNIDVQANAEEVRIARAQAKFAGGTVSMSGVMPVKQLLAGTAEAQVTARGVHLAPVDGVNATMDADLTIGVNGRSEESATSKLPRVTGDVMLTQFDYTRPINLTTDFSALGGRAKRTVVDSYDPALDAVTLEVRVRARAPIRIRNNLVEVQLGIDSGALTVSGTNQRLGLRGDLKALPGGRFHLRGSEFEVRQAFIRFDDPTRIAPNVDVIAVTDYRRYTDTTAASAAGAGAGAIASGGTAGTVWHITLHAYGDADNLRLDMTSDPPLSQEDIVLLLTIGMTRAEVDQLQAGSLGASAALEALATVSGADKAVKSAIPIIDDFRFGSAYDPRSGRTEPQVTVGKRLTENVRASVSSGLTSDQDREVRSILEWRLNQRLSVQGSYDNINDVSSTVGNVGVDLRWRLEFE